HVFGHVERGGAPLRFRLDPEHGDPTRGLHDARDVVGRRHQVRVPVVHDVQCSPDRHASNIRPEIPTSPSYDDAMPIRITRVYTRAGDSGETALVGGRRVPKDSPRIEAYGSVDELNAVIELLRVEDARQPDDGIQLARG